jgi:hypothetical protein
MKITPAQAVFDVAKKAIIANSTIKPEAFGGVVSHSKKRRPAHLYYLCLSHCSVISGV